MHPRPPAGPAPGATNADAAASAAAAAAALSLESLTCRLCSLDHLLIRLPVLETSLHEKQVALLHLPCLLCPPVFAGVAICAGSPDPHQHVYWAGLSVVRSA